MDHITRSKIRTNLETAKDKFTSHSRMDEEVKTSISGYKHMENPPQTYYCGEGIMSLLKSLITGVTGLKIFFGEAKENWVIKFNSWPNVQTMGTTEYAGGTVEAGTGTLKGAMDVCARSEVRGSHSPTFQDPSTMIIASGQSADFALSCDIEAHMEIRVRAGVIKIFLVSRNVLYLLLLDEMQVAGSMILVLRQPYLEVPSQFQPIRWLFNRFESQSSFHLPNSLLNWKPSSKGVNSESMKNAMSQSTSPIQERVTSEAIENKVYVEKTAGNDLRVKEKCAPGESSPYNEGLRRAGTSGDCETNATCGIDGWAHPDGISRSSHEPLLEETQVLCVGHPFFRSEVYGVELELQEGSLEQDVNVAVTISPQLRFVVCQTEYQGRTLSEEFLAMPFVSGPEGVVFREDKPALLRFYLGLANDFLPEDVTDLQSVDEAIKNTVREWYSPLSSPDGKGDWVSLGSYAVKYRHEGKYREVWVETPLRHFCILANGVKINIPGYQHDTASAAPYYYEPMGWLRKAMRMRAASRKIRFGNATENCATFTSWPIIQTTEAIDEARLRMRAGNPVVEGEVSGHRRSEVRGRHLPPFQELITTVVPSGTFVDCEISCDIKTHKQMHVRVGVLKDLYSSDPEATGKLQLLDDKSVSKNMVLVLRQPRLSTPSQFLSIPWPCDNESIKNASTPRTSDYGRFGWFRQLM